MLMIILYCSEMEVEEQGEKDGGKWELLSVSNDKLASETPEGSVISWGVVCFIYSHNLSAIWNEEKIHLEPCCAYLWSLANVSQTWITSKFTLKCFFNDGMTVWILLESSYVWKQKTKED